MKTLTTIAAVLLSTAVFAGPAQYEHGSATVSAASLNELQYKIEDAKEGIDNSVSKFVSGVVLIGAPNCGKVLKRDRDEAKYKWPKLRMKTRRQVTGTTVKQMTSYTDGAFVETYKATINFICLVD